LVRATTRKRKLVAVFLEIAGRIPGVDHTVDVLKRLPIDVKHRARRSTLVRRLGVIDRQLRDSRQQIRKCADSVEGLAVQASRR
jgi:hypothetical protein